MLRLTTTRVVLINNAAAPSRLRGHKFSPCRPSDFSAARESTYYFSKREVKLQDEAGGLQQD